MKKRWTSSRQRRVSKKFALLVRKAVRHEHLSMYRATFTCFAKSHSESAYSATRAMAKRIEEREGESAWFVVERAPGKKGRWHWNAILLTRATADELALWWNEESGSNPKRTCIRRIRNAWFFDNQAFKVDLNFRVHYACKELYEDLPLHRRVIAVGDFDELWKEASGSGSARKDVDLRKYVWDDTAKTVVRRRSEAATQSQTDTARPKAPHWPNCQDPKCGLPIVGVDIKTESHPYEESKRGLEKRANARRAKKAMNIAGVKWSLCEECSLPLVTMKKGVLQPMHPMARRHYCCKRKYNADKRSRERARGSWT